MEGEKEAGGAGVQSRNRPGFYIQNRVTELNAKKRKISSTQETSYVIASYQYADYLTGRRL